MYRTNPLFTILLKYIQSDSNELERAFELELNKIEGGIKLP